MTLTRVYRKVMSERSLSVEKTPDSIPADLLLPSSLMSFALSLKTGSGEWRDLIAYLVNRHRARILQIAEGAQNLRFHYQEKGLNLRRVCYVPYRDTIAEMRMLSFASRISMCALVVLMLIWEKERLRNVEIDRFSGVTIKFESGWTKVGGILFVSASVLIPAATHAPPS